MNLKILFSLLIAFITSDLVTTLGLEVTTTTTKPDLESCSQICVQTYPLHTYPLSENLNACNRGCRFYQLSDTKHGSDANSVKTKCLNGCTVAYGSNETELYACSIGCNNSRKVQLNKHEDENIGDQSISDNQLFQSPFNLIRTLFHSIVNRGSVIVEHSSMAVYMTRNSDGQSKLIIVQSEPEVVVHQYPELNAPNALLEYESESVTGNDERTTADNKPKIELSMYTNENPLLVNHPQSENSWSNCFGYRSGVPRWILASVLFIAIFVLAWICCATTATAPEQHIKRRVGIGSDLKYLCLYDEPIKLVINDKPPSYQQLQAEQLPHKTSIDNKDSNP